MGNLLDGKGLKIVEVNMYPIYKRRRDMRFFSQIIEILVLLSIMFHSESYASSSF